MQRDELSYCRICAAACGIVVTVDGDRVVRVRGDEDHPVSRGYTCSKGRGLAAWHHSPRRLDRPRLHGRDVTWDELLADLAERLDLIIDASGPDAVALYLATGLAYDAAGQIAASQWLPSIGSRSFLTAVTVDNAPVLVAAELVSGEPMLNPVWDPTVPGLAIFVGTNPVVSHGYGTALPDPIRYLREYRARGGRVWVLDPRRTETAARADVHVPVRPGADVAVLAALANALLESGADEHELSEHCDAAEVAALAHRARRVHGRAGRGDGRRRSGAARAARRRRARAPGTHRDALRHRRDDGARRRARGVAPLGRPHRVGLARSRHRHALPPRCRPPAPPAAPGTRGGGRCSEEPARASRVLGQIPAVALVDEIEAGNIRALFVTGGNPLTAFPQPARLEAALKTLDVLAVVDVADNRSPRSRRTCCRRPASWNAPTSRSPSSPRCDPACRRRGRSSSRARTADRSGGCSRR